MVDLLERLKRAFRKPATDTFDHTETGHGINDDLLRNSGTQVAQTQQLTIASITKEKHLAIRLQEHQRKLSQAIAAAEQAAQSGDEVGVRRAVEARLLHQSQYDSMSEQLQQAQDHSESLKQQLTSLQRQLVNLGSKETPPDAQRKGAHAIGELSKSCNHLSVVDNNPVAMRSANSFVVAPDCHPDSELDADPDVDNLPITNSPDDIEQEMARLRDQFRRP